MELDQFIADSRKPTEILRALAVKHDLAGISRSQTALLVGRSVSFVSKWRLIYDEHGADGLASLHQGGSSRAFLDAAQIQAVLGYIRRQRSLKLTDLKAHLQTAFGVVYRSDQSYYALLHRAGFSHHKSHPSNARRDPALVRQTRKMIKKNSGR